MLAATKIVLASSSPWRLKLLHDAGVPCEGVAPNIDEALFSAENPEELALLLALEKAQKVADLRPGAIVIAADQVAHLGAEAFGKPRDERDHFERLQSLRGKVHHLTTGVCMVFADELIQFSVRTGVRFRDDLTDSEIQAYVDCGEGKNCAGGYQIEGRGAWLIESLEGDLLNGIGLPVFDVVSALRQRGWRFDGEARAGSGPMG